MKIKMNFLNNMIDAKALAVTILILFFATGVQANEFDPAAFDDKLGETKILVFSKGVFNPVVGAEVRVGPVIMGHTNEDGALKISLFGGLYHLTVDIGDGIERIASVRVVAEQISEVIFEVEENTDSFTVSVEQTSLLSTRRESAVAGLRKVLVEGKVLHVETKKPVVGARIFVRGLTNEARTDENGQFQIEVPEGVHDFVAVHPDFSTVTVTGKEVSGDLPLKLSLEASPGGVEFEDLTVTAPRIEGSGIDILSERKEATKVSDIIGAEQISKSGDSDAASALKRVTGITIVGGKYVYVRGLGERYSSTLLNDLRLPSPDPERRVVPLDMFPAGILNSMVIQKTFSPEMPGDFGGGTVNLYTKKYPSDLMLKIELTGGINPGTTFAVHEFGADKGKTDFLGIDGGHRRIPEALKEATKDSKLVVGDRFSPGYTSEEVAEISRSMRNNWKTEDNRLPPNLGLSITGGNGYTIKKVKTGFFASLLYKNEWETKDKIVKNYMLSDAETKSLAVNSDYRFFETVNNITLGGMLNLGIDLGEGQSISADTLIDRITDNEMSRYKGYSADIDGNINVLNLNWTERMLFVQQVRGNHLLHSKSRLQLDWRYAFSSAAQDEPDARHTRYDYLENRDLWVLSSGSAGNGRKFITVDEKAHDMGLDLSFPFKQWSKEEGKIKAGGAFFVKDREVDLRSFGYENVGSMDLSVRALPPWEVFVDDNIQPGGMKLQEWTQPTDNYKGNQEIMGWYLSSDLPLGYGFSASGGVRFEKSIQEVSTFDVFSLEEEVVRSDINTFDILPSVVLTYRFYKDMLVRLGYGKTLNRPDFREMSPGCVSSYAGGGEVCGAPKEIPNPNWSTGSEAPRYLPYKLNRTVIHNLDVRWEWYFGDGAENFSVGGFYKNFIDPIESIMRASSQKGSILLNAEGATDLGVELEFRKNLGFFHKALEDLYIAGNAAWIYSRIEIPKIKTLVQTSKERPLQGQSPYIINAQIGYDNVDIGFNAALLYNVYGRRISDVGTNGRPDIYEQPFHQLDFAAKKEIKHGLSLGIKAKNIIDLPSRFTQGEETAEQYKKGREISMSLGWSY